MELTRTVKINSVSGCCLEVDGEVPIPVFIALYRGEELLSRRRRAALRRSCGCTDLSIRDPFFILPAIMMGYHKFLQTACP